MKNIEICGITNEIVSADPLKAKNGKAIDNMIKIIVGFSISSPGNYICRSVKMFDENGNEVKSINEIIGYILEKHKDIFGGDVYKRDLPRKFSCNFYFDKSGGNIRNGYLLVFDIECYDLHDREICKNGNIRMLYKDEKWIEQKE